jgi:uncharacterized RmlC-like cupin family protein
MSSKAVVVSREVAAEAVGPQGQALTPLVTAATAGVTALSSGVVRMPPGGLSRAHTHRHSEIIVAVLSGAAATIVWEDGQPRSLPHGVGQMCYVPAGVPHCAVNLSDTQPVIALEFRTDPEFNADVVLLPELDGQAAAVAAELRARQPELGHSAAAGVEPRDWAPSEPVVVDRPGSLGDSAGPPQ